MSLQQSGGGDGGLGLIGPILLVALVGIGLLGLLAAAAAIANNNNNNNGRSSGREFLPSIPQPLYEFIHTPEFDRIATFAAKSIAKWW